MEIARTMGFSIQELDLNRVGRLSPHQTTENMKEAIGWGGVPLVGVGIFVLVLFSGRIGVFRILFSVLWLAVASAGGLCAYRAMQAARSPRVEATEGILRIEYRRSVRRLIVDSFSTPFDPPRGSPQVLVTGAKYRVYYLAGLGRFLSMEPVLRDVVITGGGP